MDIKTGRPNHINDALAQLHRNIWYKYTSKDQVYANLILTEKIGIGGELINNPVTELPSEETVNAKLKELQDDFDEELNLKSILFLIGVQELGQGIRDFDKEEKTYLLHIATCKLLSPFGYYKFKNIDEDGWLHYEELKDLENLNPESQEKLMKKSIINYFK